MSSSLRDELIVLSRAIHGSPELAYQERQAVANIAALLGRHGHDVERHLGGVETAFRARVGPAGPSVALLAEYDALPDIGHACGHNLIAMSNVGAFLLAAQRRTDLQVGIELIGTPAEESGGALFRFEYVSVAALDTPVAYAPDLEEVILPQPDTILEAMRGLSRR